jgi:Domain of unknown function (DUF4326)
MSKPKRVQYSRAKGSRVAGPGVRYCGRPGPFGNEYIIGKTLPDGTVIDHDTAVELHRRDLAQNPELIARIRTELSGYDALGCRCGLDESCHVDTILRVLAGGAP